MATSLTHGSSPLDSNSAHWGPAFDRARVSDAMHRVAITCQSEAPLRTVAQIMAAEHIHSVVVERGEYESAGRSEWSIVTDLDLVRMVADDIDERTAGWAGAGEFVTVSPDESLARAAQLMVEHECTHLVVIDPNGGRPIGVLSTLDIAGAVAAETA